MTRQELTALPLATLKEMAINLTVAGDKRRKETFVNALIANEIQEQEAVQSPAPIIVEQPAAELPATDAPATKTSNASIVAVVFIAIIYVFCQLLSATVKLTVITCFAAYNLAVKVKQSIPTPKSAQAIDYFPEPA
jgi:hypothetical protein